MRKGVRALGPYRGYAAVCMLVALAAASIAAWGKPQVAQGLDTENSIASSAALMSGGNSGSAKKKEKHKHRGAASSRGGPAPAAEIPIGPLGFAPPAPFYLGDRYAQASLDFLDENSLLFTFRVPGLIARSRAGKGQDTQNERHIRAVVLSIPDGKVNAEALWTLHDHAQYLWPLRDGRFVLRDRDSLEIGNSSLRLTPYLHFPGTVNHIEFDPEQDWLIADTTEPAPARQEQAANGASASVADLPSSAAASVVTHGGTAARDANGGMRDLVRILDAKSGKVRLYSQINGVVHLPVDGEGYYEALRGDGDRWMIAYEYFSGQTRPLGWVQSTCDPPLDVPAANVVVASGCLASGERQLSLLMRGREKDQGRLWTAMTPANQVWPQLQHSRNGLRLVRATLTVNHPVGIYNPLDADDIRGQMVQVFDLATGRPAISVPASPVLDGGGNFALSPSGNRLAVLNAGAIQIYDLPPAPAMPSASSEPKPPVKP